MTLLLRYAALQNLPEINICLLAVQKPSAPSRICKACPLHMHHALLLRSELAARRSEKPARMNAGNHAGKRNAEAINPGQLTNRKKKTKIIAPGLFMQGHHRHRSNRPRNPPQPLLFMNALPPPPSHAPQKVDRLGKKEKIIEL